LTRELRATLLNRVFDLLLWTSSINDKCLKENAENIFIPSGVKISDKRRTFRYYNCKIHSSFSTVDTVKLVLLTDIENLNWVEERRCAGY
jgi:hypothetical protein